MAGVAVLATLTLASSSAASTTSFVGDYETGNYSQWGAWVLESSPAMPESCCFNVVTDPVRQGRYAAQYTVGHGYSPYGWNESTEVHHFFSDQGQGSDYYYTFSLLFPQGWVDPHGWGVVEQFYAKNYSAFWGPPPISIDASDNRLGLNINAGLSPITGGPNFQWEYSHYFQLAPSLSLGQWNDVVMHVRWAADHTGVLQVWWRTGTNAFQQVLDLSGIPTLRYNPSVNGGAADSIGSIKEGLYRASYCAIPVTLGCSGPLGVQPTDSMVHDAFSRSATYADALAEWGASASPSVAPPSSTSAPTISGTVEEGQALTAATGGWSGSPTSYAYQWRSCDSGGANCGDIGNASSSTYSPSAADVGKTLRVVVTAANGGGSTAEASAQTAVVQAASSSGGGSFGKTSVGANWDAIGADFKDGRRATLSTGGSLREVDAYVKGIGAPGTELFRAVVYKADASGGAPGTRVAVSDEVSIGGSAGPAWARFTFPSTVSLAAGDYWLVLFAGGSKVAAVAADRAGGVEAYNQNAYSSGASDPFGTPNYSTSDYSIYGVVG